MITGTYHKYPRFSRSYLRWRAQLTALGKGNLRMVRRIANQARIELEAKTRGAQLSLVN